MKKYIFPTLILIILHFSTISSIPFFHLSSQSQSQEQLVLRMSRDFGYSSGSGQIQGTFSMKITGPDTLMRVVFFIDDQSIGEDEVAPYSLRFTTDSFSLGIHSMYAKGYTSDGAELKSNVVTAEYVTADEGWKAGAKFAVPLLVIVFGAMILGFVIPMLTGRENKHLPLGTPRKYGISGGSICPKCKRPFVLHLMSPNIGFSGKFDRCPYCGKWSMVRPKSLSELRDAEAAEVEQSQGALSPVISEEERLKRDLDSSKYDNL